MVVVVYGESDYGDVVVEVVYGESEYRGCRGSGRIW